MTPGNVDVCHIGVNLASPALRPYKQTRGLVDSLRLLLAAGKITAMSSYL